MKSWKGSADIFTIKPKVLSLFEINQLFICQAQPSMFVQQLTYNLKYMDF